MLFMFCFFVEKMLISVSNRSYFLMIGYNECIGLFDLKKSGKYQDLVVQWPMYIGGFHCAWNTLYLCHNENSPLAIAKSNILFCGSIIKIQYQLSAETVHWTGKFWNVIQAARVKWHGFFSPRYLLVRFQSVVCSTMFTIIRSQFDHFTLTTLLCLIGLTLLLLPNFCCFTKFLLICVEFKLFSLSPVPPFG